MKHVVTPKKRTKSTGRNFQRLMRIAAANCGMLQRLGRWAAANYLDRRICFQAFHDDRAGALGYAVPDSDDIVGVLNDFRIADQRRVFSVSFIVWKKFPEQKAALRRITLCKGVRARRAAGQDFAGAQRHCLA